MSGPTPANTNKPDEHVRDSETARKGMLHSVRHYLPAHKDIQNALQSVTDRIKQYLPEPLSSRPPGKSVDKNLLSSKEVPWGSRSSVGSLPRTVSEDSLVDVPQEERAREGDFPQNATNDVPSKEAPSEPASDYSEVNVSKFPEERRQELLASRATARKRHRRTGGSGSPPGERSESSVAKLPEERHQGASPSHDADAEGCSKSDGTGSLPGTPFESSIVRLPNERNQEARASNGTDQKRRDKIGGARPHPGGPQGNQVESPEERTHLKEDAPGDRAARAGGKPQELREKVKGLKEKVTGKGSEHTSHESFGKSTGAPHTLSPAHTTSSTSETAAEGSTSCPNEHKFGLREKMRGEAKILSGRLEGNERKVEEGRNVVRK